MQASSLFACFMTQYWERKIKDILLITNTETKKNGKLSYQHHRTEHTSTSIGLLQYLKHAVSRSL